MPTYRVIVQYSETHWRERVMTVTAKSKAEAGKIALETAGDNDYEDFYDLGNWESGPDEVWQIEKVPA